MFRNIVSGGALMFAAVAAAAVAVPVIAPAAAQAAADADRAMAESLVDALNGRRAARRNWGDQHFASDRLRESQVERLNALAVRFGELTMTDVANGQGALVVGVRDERGRTGSIQLLRDPDRPDKVLSVTVNGL